MRKKRQLRHHLFVFLALALPSLLWGQETQKRTLSLSLGIAKLGAKEEAYSPLAYTGSGPVIALSHRLVHGQKTEFVLGHALQGKLANRFGAEATYQAYGLEHGTLYALKSVGSHHIQLGWMHRNHLQIIDFEGASNYSPRFSFHTTLGAAAEYQLQFPGAEGRFRFTLFGHVQLLGLLLPSGYVSNAPVGQEADPHARAAGWLQSLRPFHPGRGWDLSLRPALAYGLSDRSSLAVAYRYDGFSLRGVHRNRQSQGQYLITLTTQL